MSARLSRRCAAPSYFPPLTEMSTDDSLELLALVNRREVEFEDLPERYQRLILAAEANRRCAIESLRSTQSAESPAKRRRAPAHTPVG